MGKSKRARRQGGQFDKIFRENIEAVIPSLIRKLLHIHAVQSEELPDDFQHTKERRPDVLKKITDIHQNIFIIHLEIQLSDEPDMVFRMADYHLMLYRKYRIPVEQFVIYIGTEKPRMPLKFISERHSFEFRMIVLSEIDYAVFLHAADPGEIVFAVLGNFRGESPETAVTNIISRIHETTQSEFALMRYLVQLRVLSQIRKLESITRMTMESISKFFSEERDYLYIKGKVAGLEAGIEAGESKRNLALTESLLLETDFDDEKIAKLVGVSLEIVCQVRASISKG
jgi:predicted transposase/invertase (TIGR01784 family)